MTKLVEGFAEELTLEAFGMSSVQVPFDSHLVDLLKLQTIAWVRPSSVSNLNFFQFFEIFIAQEPNNQLTCQKENEKCRKGFHFEWNFLLSCSLCCRLCQLLPCTSASNCFWLENFSFFYMKLSWGSSIDAASRVSFARDANILEWFSEITSSSLVVIRFTAWISKRPLKLSWNVNVDRWEVFPRTKCLIGKLIAQLSIRTCSISITRLEDELPSLWHISTVNFNSRWCHNIPSSVRLFQFSNWRWSNPNELLSTAKKHSRSMSINK